VILLELIYVFFINKSCFYFKISASEQKQVRKTYEFLGALEELNENGQAFLGAHNIQIQAFQLDKIPGYISGTQL
jgi:hypothetical protein